MSLISIDSESHWVFRSLKDNILPFEIVVKVNFGYFSEFERDSYKSSPLLEYSASFCWIPYQVFKPSLTVMHLPYLVKLDGTTPSCIFV